jgi:hypothetical protein
MTENEHSLSGTRLRDALVRKLNDPSEGIVVLQSGAASNVGSREVACDALGRLAEIPFSPDSVQELPREEARVLIRFAVDSLGARDPDDARIVASLEALLLPVEASAFSTYRLASHSERATTFVGRGLLGSSIEVGLISVRPDGFEVFWIGDED